MKHDKQIKPNIVYVVAQGGGVVMTSSRKSDCLHWRKVFGGSLWVATTKYRRIRPVVEGSWKVKP